MFIFCLVFGSNFVCYIFVLLGDGVRGSWILESKSVFVIFYFLVLY